MKETTRHPCFVRPNTYEVPPTDITLRGHLVGVLNQDLSLLVAEGLTVRSKRLSCTTTGEGSCDMVLSVAGLAPGVYPMRIRNELGVPRPGVTLTGTVTSIFTFPAPTPSRISCIATTAAA